MSRPARGILTAVRAPYDAVFYAPWIGPVLSPGSGLPPGGTETQVVMMAREMARRGLRVALITYDTPARVAPVHDGVDVVALRRPSGPTALRALRVGCALVRIAARMRTRSFVQMSAGIETGFMGLMALLKRRRFVYSCASDLDFDYARVEPRRLSVAMFHLGIRLAGAIVVQNPEQQRLCREKFGRSSHLIKSLAEPAAGPPGRPEAFLWVGRLAWYKRPLAFVELARAVPEARFRMVGVASGPGGREAAQEVADAAQGLSNLELLAPRPRHELLELVDTAVAMVSTSDFEGMPNVFLEAWVRGVPALALAHDPDGVLVREGVGGFAGGSPERLAELARAMWASRHDREPLAGRCRDYVEREHASGAVIDRWVAALGVESPGPHR